MGKRLYGGCRADARHSHAPSTLVLPMFFSTVSIALRAIAANRLRSALTMLGVMIGITAVIALQAIGQGQRAAQLEIYDKMGANRVMVFAGWGRRGGVGTQNRLELADAEAILQASSVARVSPTSGLFLRLQYKANTLQTEVTGVLPEYFTVENYRMRYGRAITAEDVTGWERVTVLGAKTAEDLFGMRDPTGEQVKIAGKMFEVIGVTVEKGQLPWFNPDEIAIVPLTTAQRKLGAGDVIGSITVQTLSSELGEVAEEEIKEVLKQRHPAYARDEDLFGVYNATEMQRDREAAAKVIQTFLLVVGGIALFIGGIGIMNIMLVTVTERTREIGLRKALGATPLSIMGQFLTEAMVLCVLSSFLGVGAGIGISKYLEKASATMDFPTPILDQQAIVAAVVVALLVGIIFGTMPAIRASRLEPMRALRHE